MNVWKQYEGKKIFLRTKYDRVYSGIVKDVSEVFEYSYFITLINMQGKFVTISTNDIVEIKEEE